MLTTNHLLENLNKTSIKHIQLTEKFKAFANSIENFRVSDSNYNNIIRQNLL